MARGLTSDVFSGVDLVKSESTQPKQSYKLSNPRYFMFGRHCSSDTVYLTLFIRGIWKSEVSWKFEVSWKSEVSGNLRCFGNPRCSVNPVHIDSHFKFINYLDRHKKNEAESFYPRLDYSVKTGLRLAASARTKIVSGRPSCVARETEVVPARGRVFAA